jgi:uncharacterized RDD family membrane protein YckC
MSATHDSAAPDDKVAQFLDGVSRNRRQILTPEGVLLPVDLAEPGERAVALVIDLLAWLCVTVLLYLAIVALLIGGMGSEVAVTAILFLAFLVRNLYFVYFELAWQGATPGKWISRLRVIDRRGGPLMPSAVFARNLTREVEMFLPVGLMLSLSVGAGASVWQRLALLAWFGLFAALPLFNRDRMRGGDFIAGTIVIAIPKHALLADLVENGNRYSFSSRQLAAYGAFELQVLEELLRRPRSAQTMAVLTEVCGKICARIGWPAPVPAAEVVNFLTEFYSAERAFLERERLYGRHREDKNSRPD